MFLSRFLPSAACLVPVLAAGVVPETLAQSPEGGGASPSFKTGTVAANGLEFHFLEMGEGPLVLALHGFPDHARSFRHQLPALAGAGYRVVAPYLRGYAPTEVLPDGPYQIAALAQDALALIEELGKGEKAVLMGHDWGASAAYAAAAVAPEKISKLITMAVPYGPGLLQSFVTNPAQQRRSWYMFFFQTPFAEAAVAHDDFAFIDRLWQDWSPGWEYPPEEMAALKATLDQPGVLQAAINYYRHTFNPPPTAPDVASLQQQMTGPIAVPTLYIHGAKDGCIGQELAAGMEALFPQGLDKFIVDGAGHFVHQEKPEEVNHRILEFLKP